MFELTIKGNTVEELYDLMQELLHKRNPVTFPGKGVPAQQGVMTLHSGQTAPAAIPSITNTAEMGKPMGNPIPPAAPTSTAAPIMPPAAPGVPNAASAPLAPTQTNTTLPPATTANPGVPQAPAPTYNLDQLARAGATLAQSGKMEDALALLARYGVQTVNQLKPEQYGAFAAELRALGAQV